MPGGAADWGYWLTATMLGGGVGVLSGCFGAGGGFLLTPALNILLGVDMRLAVGTSVLQVTGTSAAALGRQGFSWRMFGIRLAAVVAAGIPAGAWLGARSVAALQARWPESVDAALLGVFAAFLLAVGGWLVFDNFMRAGSAEGDGATARPSGWLRHGLVPPFARFRCLDGRRFSVPALVGLGAGTGFLGGLLGIGGGVVMLPLLSYAVGVEARTAARMSSALVFVTGMLSALFHAEAGNVDYTLAAVLLAGALPGTWLGAKLHRRLPHRSMLGWFGVVVLLAWAVVAWRWWRLAGE